MNIKTGELYEKFEDGLKEALENGFSEAEAMEFMMPLEQNEFKDLTNMNRAQRRQWARENKKKK